MPDLRQRQRLAPLIALALAAALAAGCGDNKSGGGRKLSPASATALRGTLDAIENAVIVHDCSSADERAGTLRGQVESLSRVGSGLRRALEASTAHLESLVASQCETTKAPSGSQGSTGASGATGATSEGTTGGQGQPGKKKGPKKVKPPKDKGQQPSDEGGTPGVQGGGGGAGLPGESTQGGGN
jgi:hypothetical protein